MFEKETVPAEEDKDESVPLGKDESVPDLPDVRETSASRRRSKGKGLAKRKRSSSGINLGDDRWLGPAKRKRVSLGINSGESCEALSKAFTPAGQVPSIKECMALVRECGMDELSETMHTACKLMYKPQSVKYLQA